MDKYKWECDAEGTTQYIVDILKNERVIHVLSKPFFNLQTKQHTPNRMANALLFAMNNSRFSMGMDTDVIRLNVSEKKSRIL